MSRNKRDELVEKSLWLFYRNGFHATGMDLVAKETGVSKTSIYKHFRTKDDLILAVLELRDTNFRGWLIGRMEALASTPEGQLLAMFDAIEEWFRQDGFQGCMFVKASAEFQTADDPINRQALAHKQVLTEQFSGLARMAGFADPLAIAKQLMVLKEGAIVLAAMSHTPEPAHDARALAELLFKTAERRSPE